MGDLRVTVADTAGMRDPAGYLTWVVNNIKRNPSTGTLRPFPITVREVGSFVKTEITVEGDDG